MTRRDFVELVTFAASSSFAASQAKTSSRPNIILLLGDDHRADALGCARNRYVKTPHLDKMAAEGLLFANHFCTTPICCVSRASIMTGQYAAPPGINDIDKPLSVAQVQRSYFGRMRSSGYFTGFIGKFGVGSTMPSQAFDVWEGFGGQGQYFPQGENGPHLTDTLSEQALDFVRKAPRDKPFCLSVSFKAPHEQDEDPRTYLPSAATYARYAGMNPPLPQGAPESDIERFPLAIQRSENRRRWSTRYTTAKLRQETMKGYYALISGIDDAIGALRKELTSQGLADNTVIL
jgi:arylsulfatase A-like enzyme